jgi:hypothetical protein
MQSTKKRPFLLSFICITGYLWIVFTFPGVFSPEVKKLGDWYPALFGLVVALSFISFIGVWHMKQWGVNLYIGTFFFKQVLHVITDQMGFGAYVGILFSTLFIIAFVCYYRRMDVNL